MDKLSVQIQYFDKICEIGKISKGDWIDLRSREEFHYSAGTHVKIPLGIAMKIPVGYEAHVAPRGSTFKNFGLIATNSVGVVDSSYCGPNDEWFFTGFALKDGVVLTGDRICQFRIIENMPELEIEVVDKLEYPDRGAYGSTGVT